MKKNKKPKKGSPDKQKKFVKIVLGLAKNQKGITEILDKNLKVIKDILEILKSLVIIVIIVLPILIFRKEIINIIESIINFILRLSEGWQIALFLALWSSLLFFAGRWSVRKRDKNINKDE